jgi:hypothetical protein
MVRKRIYQVGSKYFHLAFERLFSDFSFSKSLRHKTRTFHAYTQHYINVYASQRIKEEEVEEEEEKEEEKKQTRAALHESSMLRIAFKRTKLAQHYMNALCFVSH